MTTIGKRDEQTAEPLEATETATAIAGVLVIELRSITTRSGVMMEVFRDEWPGVSGTIRQVNWQHLKVGGVTDWHMHHGQTDQIVGVEGAIRLALYDAREDSATKGAHVVVHLGADRPPLVIVPPRVWHALRNEGPVPAGYINLTTQLYRHEHPDNWRLDPDASDIPDIL